MIYPYKCENCEHEMEVQQSLKEYKVLKKCPKCKKNKLIRVYSSPYIAIAKEPTTLGHLADKNTKKMGKYEYQDKEHQRKERKKLAKSNLPGSKVEKPQKNPWWRTNNDRPMVGLNKLSEEQKKKYIMTGEK